MLRSNPNVQNSFEFVCLEDLVPQGHLLRKIQKHVDFSFILEKVKPYYCEDNGRPSIDPIMLFKMMFIGYLYGVRSERQLEQEIQLNVAYRWFVGLGLTDRVPDHSTLSLNRKRLQNTNVVQEIFDHIVFKAIELRMVAGRVLVTDSTHLKANANKRKFVKQEVEKSVKSYLDELDEAVEADRKEHGKKL